MSLPQNHLIRNPDDRRTANLAFIRKNLSEISFIKTFYYNFRHLPFQKARKLPILIGTKTRIKHFGVVNLPDNCYLGMLSIGVRVIKKWEDKDEYTSFSNYGTVDVTGQAQINWGCKLFVRWGAVLHFGDRVKIGSRNRVICYKSISIGDNVRFAWEAQLFDTDFHFLIDIENGKHYPRVKPIIIGNNVFVGNRCTIAKGTVIPDGCVISCGSMVKGDFSKEGGHLLLKGNPAVAVKKNVEMTSSWFQEEEERIAKEMDE